MAMKQASIWIEGPQALPPFRDSCGKVLSQILVPTPHVWEHPVHSLHSSALQFIGQSLGLHISI